MRKHVVILLIIISFAFFLRVVNLGTNPPANHADEADTGYTAYSLIKTLHDPYGNFLPLHFQGQANIYRAPLYTYSTIPFVYVYGLSPFSERLPSAIWGTLFVLIIYLLAKKLFVKEEIALLAAFLTAINPWSILISRTGLEVQLCALLVSIGVYFFLFVDKNKWFMVLGSLFFGLSLFAYHPAKIFTPIFSLFLLIYFSKTIVKNKLASIAAITLFAVSFGVILFMALFLGGAAEYKNVTAFDPNRASEIVNMQRTQTLAPLKISSVFNNKAIYFLREFTNHYIGPISINYMFVNGENSLDKGLSNYGQFHLFELPFIFFGAFLLFRKHKREFILLAAWVIAGLVPGGVTGTGYYSYRDVLMLPALLLLSGFGGYNLYKFLFSKGKIYAFAYTFFAIILFAYYSYIQFFAYPVYSRDWWANTQKQVIFFINDNKKNYTKTYIQGGVDWMVLYAFYNRISPVEFQAAFKNKKDLGGAVVRTLDGITIGDFIKNDAATNLTPGMETNSLLIVPGHYFKKEIPKKLFTSVDGVNVELKAFVVNEK